MRLYLSFDKPWLELKIDKILIKIKLIKLIFFKLTLLKILKLCVSLHLMNSLGVTGDVIISIGDVSPINKPLN